MYMSCLLIELGSNPDRPRPGRLWIRNRYHVHQRLCMAFPAASRKAQDVNFLKPFNPNDFSDGQVHVVREMESGFLFRIDPCSSNHAVILVQSAIKPDWEYAFYNARHLLAAPPEVKSFEPRLSKGQCFRFRLVANPTRRLSKKSPDVKAESIGKRVPVPTDQFIQWLARRGKLSGFSINNDYIVIIPSYVYVKKDKSSQGQHLRSVLYEGLLQITDPDAFRQTLIRGIGSGKAFGFGLLSLAPASAAGMSERT